MKVGEHVSLPHVRSNPEDALIIADGFSCREQIAQGTKRHALHLAEVLTMALGQGPTGPARGRPEANYVTEAARLGWKSVAAVAAVTIMASWLAQGGEMVHHVLRQRQAHRD